MPTKLNITIILLLALGLLVGCGSAQPETGIPDDAALKITGKVANETGWSEETLRAMDTMEAESTNKQGESKTYTGVSLNKLLEKAQPQAGAATLTLVGDDGLTSEVPLADAQTCPDCIVSFRNQGGFSMVMPGFSGKAQVKGVVEIQVQ
jgi:DMSO/TMAO reductase YedYZ molybdopterin-dependent catalytic subunit